MKNWFARLVMMSFLIAVLFVFNDLYKAVVRKDLADVWDYVFAVSAYYYAWYIYQPFQVKKLK